MCLCFEYYLHFVPFICRCVSTFSELHLCVETSSVLRVIILCLDRKRLFFDAKENFIAENNMPKY